MKTYQDTETGKLWAFEDNFDLKKSTNRRIPKTLTEVVKEKPDDDHLWCEGGWVHISKLPKGYEESVSSVPVYNPAWITFLFPLGTFIWPDSRELMNITLEQINNNHYKGSFFQEVATTIKVRNSELPALISFDGSLALPMNRNYPVASDALNEINHIEGALFLGGLLLKNTNHKSIECGSLSDDGKHIQSYMVSPHNRLRTNSMSLSERIFLSAPNYVKMSVFKTALTTGNQVLSSIDNLSSDFIVKGHSALVAWDLSDALSNLWISVEQLTSFIWNDKFILDLSSYERDLRSDYAKLKKAKSDWKISERHKILTKSSHLTSAELIVLDSARVKRNKLVHSAEIPRFEVVEELWFVLLNLIERHSGVSLNLLKKRTSIGQGNKFNKHYPPGFSDIRNVDKTEFPEWLKEERN